MALRRIPLLFLVRNEDQTLINIFLMNLNEQCNRLKILPPLRFINCAYTKTLSVFTLTWLLYFASTGMRKKLDISQHFKKTKSQTLEAKSTLAKNKCKTSKIFAFLSMTNAPNLLLDDCQSFLKYEPAVKNLRSHLLQCCTTILHKLLIQSNINLLHLLNTDIFHQ